MNCNRWHYNDLYTFVMICGICDDYNDNEYTQFIDKIKNIAKNYNIDIKCVMKEGMLFMVL